MSRNDGCNSRIGAEEEAERQSMREQHHLRSTSLGDRRECISLTPQVRVEETRTIPNAAEVYQQCLQLYAQNKINSKNAFNLDLIDVLPALKDVDPRNLDFGYAGKLLNVAAKIYGCRVDNVCQDTHELYNEALRSEGMLAANCDDHQSGTNQDVQQGMNENAEAKKPKRRKKAVDIDLLDLECQLEKDLSKITMTQDEFEAAMDPVYSAAKKFRDECNVEASLFQTYTVLDDSGQTAVTMLPPKSFEWPSDMPDISTKRMDKVVKKIGNIDYCGSTLSYKYRYADYCDAPSLYHLAKSLLVDSSSRSKNTTTSISNTEDELQLDGEIRSLEEPVFVTGGSDQSEDEMVDYVPNKLDLKTACSALSKQKLQYSYIIPQNIPVFNGPTSWKESMMKFSNAKKERAVVKKAQKVEPDPLSLKYMHEEDFDKLCSAGNPNTCFNLAKLDQLNCTKREVMDILYDQKNLYELYMKRMAVPRISLGCIQLDDLDSENDFHDCLSSSDHIRDDNYACLGDHPEMNGPQSSVGDETLSTDELGGFAPIMPSKQPVPITAKVKRIDVARIKKAIMKMLQKKPGESAPQGDMAEDDFRSRDFRDIFESLHRQPRLKKDMTVQSAFVCMLHVCNEQNLELVPKENGDFAVAKAKLN